MPRSVYVFLAVGLVAASQSGNLVRIGDDASAIAIAAWRLGLASLVLAAIAGPRQLAQVLRISRRQWLLLLVAGLSLGVHLWAWIASVQRTTVANSTVFFAVNPVMTAVAAHYLLGERLSGRLLLCAVLGLAGVALLGASDLAFSADHVTGDALALLCSVFFTVYFLAGRRLSPVLPWAGYTAVLFGVAAAACFAILVASGGPLVDYSARSWTCFVAMALVPTMLGHTSFNVALRHLDAGWVATSTLSEPVLAGIVAAIAWGEPVVAATVAGYGLIAAGVAGLALDRSARSG